jgi:hypothetical protein
MKNRITTPDGMRIPIDDIGPYQTYDNTHERPSVIIERRGIAGEGETIVRFNTIEERDAFLARLDNYFQEIA